MSFAIKIESVHFLNTIFKSNPLSHVARVGTAAAEVHFLLPHSIQRIEVRRSSANAFIDFYYKYTKKLDRQIYESGSYLH